MLDFRLYLHLYIVFSFFWFFFLFGCRVIDRYIYIFVLCTSIYLHLRRLITNCIYIYICLSNWFSMVFISLYLWICIYIHIYLLFFRFFLFVFVLNLCSRLFVIVCNYIYIYLFSICFWSLFVAIHNYIYTLFQWYWHFYICS